MVETAGGLRRDAQRSRDRLLDAAGELLETAGPRFTLPELARHAGVGVATVYRHFGDHTDLLAAYESRAMGRTLAEIEAVEPGEARERFRHICLVWVENSMGQGAPTRFLRSHLGMLERHRAGDPEVAAFVETLTAALQELIDTGDLPDQDLAAAVLIWVTLLDERTVVDLGRTLGWTTRKVADRLSAAAWGALGGHGALSGPAAPPGR